MRIVVSAFLVIGLLSSCMLGVQGNGRVKEATRDIDAFERISVSGMFEVYISQAGDPALKVVADENLHELIETYVENGTLYVRTKESIGRAKELDLYISLDVLEALDLSGAVSLENSGELQGDYLEIESSGAAEIKLAVDYKEISIETSGASEIQMRGEVGKLAMRSSGASEVKMFELEAKEMRLDLSGASDVEVNVSDDLAVSASGAAEIVYRGNPNISKSSLSGAASLKND